MGGRISCCYHQLAMPWTGMDGIEFCYEVHGTSAALVLLAGLG